MQDFGWPPAVVPQLDPDHLAVERHPSGFAVIAKVFVRTERVRVQVQALHME